MSKQLSAGFARVLRQAGLAAPEEVDCERWLAEGQAAIDELMEARRAKWERNRRGREQGERAWREASERKAAQDASRDYVAPAARFWPDEPGPVWVA